MILEKELKRVLKTKNIEKINQIFEKIYLNYKGLVCFVIAKYVNEREDVMDLAQEVFLSFFNNADRVSSSIKYYLTTTAKNKALNFLNKEKKISIIDEGKIDLLDDKNIYDEYLYKDIIKLLKENLKEIEFKVLILHLFDEYTFREIAVRLKMKESSVKSIYFRTLKKGETLLERRNSYE